MARSRASARYDIRADDNTSAGLRSARAGFVGLTSAVDVLGKGLVVASAAATGAAIGITALVSRNAELIDQLGKTSEKLGVSVTALQAFEDAGERADITSGQISKSLQNLADRVSEAATGIGAGKNALEELGLSAEELKDLDVDQQYIAVSDALEGVANQSDRIRLAGDLFGTRNVDLLRLTSSAINDATGELEQMGIALTEIDVAGVEEMNDTIQRLQRNASGAAQVFTAEMAPAVTGVVRQILGVGESLDGVREVSNSFADGFIDTIGFIGNGIQGLSRSWDLFVIGLQAANVGAARFTNFLEGTEESERALAATREELERLKTELSENTEAGTFWSGLERQSLAAEVQARQSAARLEEIRDRINNEVTETGNVTIPPVSTTPLSAVDDGSDFDRLLAQLRSNTNTIEGAYRARIAAVESYRQEFPAEIERANAAEAAALAARDQALAEIDGATLVRSGSEDASGLISSLEQNTTSITDAARARAAAIDGLAAGDNAAEAARSIADGTGVLSTVAADRQTALTAFEGVELDVNVRVTGDSTQEIASSFAAGTDSIQQAYDARLLALSDFAREYPDQVDDARASAVQAIESRNAALRQAQGDVIELAPVLPVDESALLASLDQTTRDIQDRYAARLVAIDDFQQAYPERAAEALQQMVAAERLRDGALADIRRERDQIADPDEEDASALLSSLFANTVAIQAAGEARADALSQSLGQVAQAITDSSSASLDDTATIAALTSGTAAIGTAIGDRQRALSALGSGVSSNTTSFSDNGPATVTTIEEGTAAIEAVVAERQRVLSSLGTQTPGELTSFEDDGPAVVATLEQGTAAIAIALGARQQAIALLGKDAPDLPTFVDNGAVVAGALSVGTGLVEQAVSDRQLALSSLGGQGPTDTAPFIDSGISVASDIEQGTAAIDDAASDRRRALSSIDTEAPDSSTSFQDDAASVSAVLDDGTAVIDRAIASRQQVLVSFSAESSSAPAPFDDNGTDIAAEIGQGTTVVEAAVDDRFGVLSSLQTQSPADQGLFQDNSVVIASTLGEGTAVIDAAVTDRQRVLASLGTQASNDSTLFEDNGIVIASALGDGTAAIDVAYRARLAALREYADAFGLTASALQALELDAAQSRSEALSNLGTEPVTASIAFDIEFPEFSAASQVVRDEYAEVIATIEAEEARLGATTEATTQARILALQERDQKLRDVQAEIASQAAEQEAAREVEQAPLVSNLEAVREQFQSETELITDLYTERQNQLRALAESDVEYRQEAADLIVALEQDKHERIKELEEQASSERIQIAATTAANIIGAGATLAAALGGQSERQKRVAARLAQVEAIVAGISAAERARNQASLYGGVVGGFAAAAASWAGTIANVAGIESALGGGTPSVSSGGASVSTASNDAINSDTVEQQSSGTTTVQNFYVLTADEIIDDEKLKERTLGYVSDASSSRELLVDSATGRLTRNSEAA